MSKIKFIKDTREKKGYSWNKTATVDGTVVKKLDVGDYSIEGLEDTVVIERKGAASELLGNLLTNDNKRFHTELQKLSMFKYKWIICDFQLSDMSKATKYIPRSKRHFFSINKVIGAIASIMVRYGVPIIFCGKPHTILLKNGRKKKTNLGKDLTKKLLMKAYKYGA